MKEGLDSTQSTRQEERRREREPKRGEESA